MTTFPGNRLQEHTRCGRCREVGGESRAERRSQVSTVSFWAPTQTQQEQVVKWMMKAGCERAGGPSAPDRDSLVALGG